MMDWSARLWVRVTAAVLAVGATALAVAVAAVVLARDHDRRLAFDQDLRDLGRQVRPAAEEALVSTTSREQPLPPGVAVVQAAGQVVAGDATLAALVVDAAHPDGVVESGWVGAVPVRWTTLPLEARPTVRGGHGPGSRGRLILARPTASLVAARTTDLVTWVVAASALGTLLGVVVAITIHRCLAPLRDLGQALAALDPEHPAPVTLPAVPEELAPVVRHLNAQLARIDAVLARERRTTADIAHELRTPLAALRAQWEALPAVPASAVAQRCRDGLGTATHLQGLVENLLLLARLEAGEVPMTGEAVDLADLVAGLVALHRPGAQARELHLAVTVEPALSCITDATYLRLVVGNLVANAVAHAPVGARVGLVAREQDGMVEVEVDNPGATITPERIEDAFRPFWRADAGRSTAHGHAGLGLALARRVALALGGSLTVVVPDGRFIATLRIPFQR